MCHHSPWARIQVQLRLPFQDHNIQGLNSSVSLSSDLSLGSGVEVDYIVVGKANSSWAAIYYLILFDGLQCMQCIYIFKQLNIKLES